MFFMPLIQESSSMSWYFGLFCVSFSIIVDKIVAKCGILCRIEFLGWIFLYPGKFDIWPFADLAHGLLSIVIAENNQGENMTLTKADIVQEVYKKHEGLTKAMASDSVESFLRLSKNSLICGTDLLLSGFGKFSVKNKKPRRGRNPQTGNELILDARRVVTFKPSGILRDKVNGSD